MRVYYCLSTSACALLFGFNVAYGLDIKTSDKLLLNTHLIDTNQNQFFETLPRAGLDINLPKRFHFKTASVSFITGNSELVFPEFPDVSVDQCKNFGYTLTSCPSGNPSGICPYNTSYFKECCDVRYKYNKNECTYPNTVSGDSCGGKFMCYCDRSLYPETKCISPMEPEGDTCVEEGVPYYSKCVCPAYFDKTCEGENLQGVGEGCTQDGVTKYTSCECKSGYNLTCSDMGPVTPTDYCLKDGVKYYNNCKTCEYKCTLDSCPSGLVCELEACSQKYCATGCAIGKVDLDNYWCNGALRCWMPAMN